jgi:hypothetical protein
MSRSPLFILIINEKFINRIKSIDKIFSYSNRGFFYVTDNREYKFYINDNIKHNDFLLEKLKNNVYKFNYDSSLIIVNEEDKKKDEKFENNNINGLIETIKQKYPNIKYIFTQKNKNILETIYNQIKDTEKMGNFDEFIKKYCFIVLEITDKNLYFIHNKEMLEKMWEIKNIVSYIEIVENAVINTIDLNNIINHKEYKKYKDDLIIVYRKCNDLDKISRILYFTNSRLSSDYIRSYHYNYGTNYYNYHNYDYYDEDEYWDRYVTTYEDLLENDEKYYIQDDIIIDKVINNIYQHDIFEHIKSADTITVKGIKEFFNTLLIIKRERTGYIITRNANNNGDVDRNSDIILCNNYFLYKLFHDLDMSIREKIVVNISYIKNKLSEFVSTVKVSKFINPIKIVLDHLMTNSENDDKVLIPADKYMIGATISGIIKQILEMYPKDQNIIIDLKSLVYIDSNEWISFSFDEITEYMTEDGDEILNYYDYCIEEQNKKLLRTIKNDVLPYIRKEFPDLYPFLTIRCSNIFCYYDEILRQLLIFDSNKDKTI